MFTGRRDWRQSSSSAEQDGGGPGGIIHNIVQVCFVKNTMLMVIFDHCVLKTCSHGDYDHVTNRFQLK